MLEPYRNDAFVRNHAHVLKKIALDHASAGFEAGFVHVDLPEEFGILLAQRFAAAREVIDHVAKFVVAQIAIWIGPPNEREGFVEIPAANATHAGEMLGEDIERRARETNGIELA